MVIKSTLYCKSPTVLLYFPIVLVVITISLQFSGISLIAEEFYLNSIFRYNINGHDLNRNFPDRFIDNPRPIQSETQAIMNWLKQYPFVLSATMHDYAVLANYMYDNYEGCE